MYKMIALDLDGTLLNEEREISEENMKQIRRAAQQGIIICISTGRGMKSAREHVAALEVNGPFVTANGSEVWSDAQTLLSRSTLPHEMVARLLDVAKRNDVWYWSYTVDGLLSKENFDGIIENVEWLKLGYYDEDISKLQAALAEIRDWKGLEISNSHPKNVEINPQGITKAVGLQQICELHGLQMSEVIACGDSLNDIEMIKAAGMGVAMGNAQQPVKEIANWITTTNDQDGVAKVIRKFIFGEE
jgi:phosphoglycolate phosphatase (TIGR01487 family)